MNFLEGTLNADCTSIQVNGASLQIPPAKTKALTEKNQGGKTVILGISPEDIHDSQIYVDTQAASVIEAKISVYELLGAEVYLYFDYAGTQVTARVDPRTTARGGDTVKFALDMEKAHFFDKDTELTIAN